MSDRIYPIEHKGKIIYYSDWRNLKTSDEAIRVMNETADFIEKLGQTNLLELLDTEGSYAPPEVLMELKKVNARVKKYSGRKAVVGVHGTRKVLLNAINSFSSTQIKAFDTLEKAKDWLVEG